MTVGGERGRKRGKRGWKLCEAWVKPWWMAWAITWAPLRQIKVMGAVGVWYFLMRVRIGNLNKRDCTERPRRCPTWKILEQLTSEDRDDLLLSALVEKVGTNVHIDTNSSDSDLAQLVCYILQMIVSFVINCINIHRVNIQYRIVTVIHEYWPFFADLDRCTHFLLHMIFYAICIIIREKVIKSNTQSWVLGVGHVYFQQLVGGGSLTFCARGWVMFF